jgi:hypothetical protein
MSTEQERENPSSEEPLDRRRFLTRLAAAAAFAVPVVTTLDSAVASAKERERCHHKAPAPPPAPCVPAPSCGPAPTPPPAPSVPPSCDPAPAPAPSPAPSPPPSCGPAPGPAPAPPPSEPCEPKAWLRWDSIF